MGDIPRPQDNWNEYRWEQEIRRDERRISCYYRELPACLDLPGEEDMIFSSLLSQPDLVPIGGNADSLRVWHSESEEEEDDEFDAGAPARTGSEIIDQLDRLAVEWNVLSVTRLRADFELPGLGISCAYGKLLARTADFINLDDKDDRALKLSLGKRALSDLNELTGELERLGREQRSIKVQALLHVEMLSHVRERLLDQLQRIREQQ